MLEHCQPCFWAMWRNSAKVERIYRKGLDLLVDNSNSISTHIIRNTGSCSLVFSGGRNCRVGGNCSISYRNQPHCLARYRSMKFEAGTIVLPHRYVGPKELLTSISYSSPPINGPKTAGKTSTPLTVASSPWLEIATVAPVSPNLTRSPSDANKNA